MLSVIAGRENEQEQRKVRDWVRIGTRIVNWIFQFANSSPFFMRMRSKTYGPTNALSDTKPCARMRKRAQCKL